MKERLVMKALFIGRFQPFHLGHLETIRWICGRVEKLYIVLAEDHEGKDDRNPYSREQRESMINHSLDDEGIKNYDIVYIPDFETVDGWYNAIVRYVPDFDTLFTGNPWIENCFKQRKKNVEHQPDFDSEKYNATKIREKIRKGEPWEHLVPKSVEKVIKSS